jgi:hypothetical protein
VATPTLAQARSHYERQRRISAAAVLAVRRLFKRRAPLTEIVRTVAAYQLASATASVNTVANYSSAESALTIPRVFAGVSSYGFPVSEPIVATIDRFVPAPAEALPDNWWDDAIDSFMGAVEQLVASEVQDAGRTASQVEMVAGPVWTNYVRMLNPPSCARCAILAGRIYRDLDEFDRHPLCDCVMVPVTDWESAHDNGLVSSAQEAFDAGQIRTRISKDSDEYRSGFSRADEQAIRDGADIAEVVNATRAGLRAPAGITKAYTTDLFGHRVKATHYGTTKRAAWRKANPSRLTRLRPESIYEIAKDREDVIRLLRLYGYIR